MTLNCDVPIEAARETFAREASDGAAADLLEATVEYWRCDKISDLELAADLRSVLPWLERTCA